jgi:TRAP-type mannitol/chloroaromatic compound transport system permease small subunit
LGPRIGAFGRLVVGMNAAGSVWVLLLILLVTGDALGRSFFAAPIVGTVELTQISIVGIVFMQLGDTVRTGRLTRSETFLDVLRRARPRAAAALEAVFCLLGAAYMAIGLWGSIPLLEEAIRRNSWIGNEGVFTAPVWPVKSVIVAGLAVCLVQFVLLGASAFKKAANWR